MGARVRRARFRVFVARSPAFDVWEIPRANNSPAEKRETVKVIRAWFMIF